MKEERSRAMELNFEGRNKEGRSPGGYSLIWAI